jgi:class 3 adenylate cyclase
VAAGEIHYAPSGTAQIAYTTIGSGPPLLWFGGPIPGLVALEQPLIRPHFESLAAFSTLVLLDPRGAGRSDPVLPDEAPTPDSQAADIVAVLDHAQIDHAAVLATHAGGGAAVVLAAEHPERVDGLVLVNCWSRLLEAPDYPFGLDVATHEQLLDMHSDAFGTGMFGQLFSPSRGADDAVRGMYAALESGSSRSQAVLLSRGAQELDVRDRLADVSAPTIVMHSRENTAIPVEHGRYLAAHVPGAELREYPGTDHAYFLADEELVRAAAEQLVTGSVHTRATDRRFAVILFSDLVDSTARAATLGDASWKALLDRHDAALADAAVRHGGRVVKATGDGALVELPMPSAAIDAARAIVAATQRLGLDSRVGIHAGEIEGRGEDVGGIAVHLAARVCGVAMPGSVTVTRTVRDLLIGSRATFVDRGEHSLKGLPEPWHLYELEG